MRAETTASDPEVIITVGTGVRVTIKVRVTIVTRIVRNVDIMPSTKRWTITVVTVCSILVVSVDVVFKVAIAIVVFQ